MAKFSTVRLAPNDTPSLTGDPKSLATLAPADSDTSLATTAWVQAAIAGFSSGASVTIGATPPGSPSVGAMWWDTTSGQLFIWYNDGTSSQWVIANNLATATPTQTRVLLQTLDPVGTVYGVIGPFTNAFDTYEIEWMLSPVSGAAQVCAHLSTDNGATYNIAAGVYHYAGSYGASNNSGSGTGGSASYFPLSMNADPGFLASGLTKVYKPWLNGFNHNFVTQSGCWTGTILYSLVSNAALMGSTLPVTHMRFLPYSGVNWGAGGYIKLYGIR